MSRSSRPGLHFTGGVLSLVLHMAMKRRKELNLSDRVKVIKLAEEGKSVACLGETSERPIFLLRPIQDLYTQGVITGEYGSFITIVSVKHAKTQKIDLAFLIFPFHSFLSFLGFVCSLVTYGSKIESHLTVLANKI